MDNHWRRAAAGMLAGGMLLIGPVLAPGGSDVDHGSGRSSSPSSAAGSGGTVVEFAHADGRLELRGSAGQGFTGAPVSASSYAFLVTVGHQPVRFDPCQVVRYRVNLGAYTRSVLPTVREALRRLSVASGLHFVEAGTTSFVPWRPGSRPPADTDLVIAIAPARTVPALAGSVIGMGGASYDGTGRVTLGQVVIEQEFVRGHPKGLAARGATVGALLVHELGHAVGLGHVLSPHEVMFPVLGWYSANGYQQGDRAGLAKVGAAAGCKPAA